MANDDKQHESQVTDQIIESSPYICVLFDEKANVVSHSKEAVKLFPFNLELGSFDYHFAQALKDGVSEFGMDITVSGEVIVFNVVLKRISQSQQIFIVAYFMQKPAEKIFEFNHHNGLLHAINTISQMLTVVESDTISDVINDSLKILGKAAGVDRVYIWENFEQNGKLYSRQTYEWSEIVEAQQGKDFTVALDYDEIPAWKAIVLSGGIYNGLVEEFEGNEWERELLRKQDIVSILIIAIHIDGKAWGLIGFDDCHSERIFDKADEKALQVCGIFLVSSIYRCYANKQMKDIGIELMNHDKLLRTVNEVARLLLETGTYDFCDIVIQTIEMLATCVGACYISVWRNTTDENGRLGASVLYEWKKNESKQHYLKPLFLDYETYLPQLPANLVDVNISISDASEKIKGLPLLRDAKSVLIMPLFIDGEFWGCITFSHNEKEYFFSDSERNILRSGGMLVASAIMRNEITENLVIAREAALASTKSKGEFLSRMSHEMRTPMNAIIGMSTLALKCNDMSKIHHYIRTIDASSRQLLGIINDVLDMSKIEANKLEISPDEFDFENMLRHVFNVVQIKMDEKKIYLRLDFPQAFFRNVVSDDLRLSQVLINLLGNAIKFTPDYGLIVLRVREIPIDKDHSIIRIEVIDNGIGIASDKISQVFQSFVQGDGSVMRRYGGTGLGLAICESIVKLMNGKIWVESELGRGSKFTIEVPIEWGKECENRTRLISIQPDLRILVIDDEIDLLEYFRSILANFSLSCDIAASYGGAAVMAELRMIEKHPYDVIFMDWNGTTEEGLEAYKKIKKFTSNEAIVAMISPADAEKLENTALSEGVQFLLTKPVLSSDVYNVLIQLAHLSNASFKEDEEDTQLDYDWSNRKILLVEDMEINREIAVGILETTGVYIECAENGKIAVDLYLAEPQKYDVILMDVQMPIMDGLSATKKIRVSGIEGSDSIPIIAMTANAFKEDERASLEAGMNAHIAKPIDIKELFNVLKMYLN